MRGRKPAASNANRRVADDKEHYDKRHRQLRIALMARFRQGDPRALCGGPILDASQIDLAHAADRVNYAGLSHRKCNRAEAARRGNRMRARPGSGIWRSARQW